MKNIQNLFSVPICNTFLNLDLNNLKLFCDELRVNNYARQKSSKGGFQIDFVKDLIKVKDLNKSVLLNIKKLAKVYNFKNNNFYISSIWVNYNCKNSYNVKHIHPNCIFSGVFYLECDEMKPAKISFFHPAYDLMNYDWNNNLFRNYIENNSSVWYFDPKPNQLILFPSWLQHQVDYNPSDKMRISISFNINHSKNEINY
jgi:uncharacterized protein (TIGR02466 family)